MSKRIVDHYIDWEDEKEYELSKKIAPKEMDDRCLLGLHSLPEDICYAAVKRLHAIKSAGRELTEQEIAVLPGCPWAVQHQRSNYCFFKYLRDYISDNPPSEQEMAHMLNCGMDDIKKAEKSAISKFKQSSLIESIRENFDDNEVVESRELDQGFTILK